MAKAPTEEQLQLRRRARRRLIGAMALVTLIAVVLPWVLEHEPRQTVQEVKIQIPSQDSKDFDPSRPPGRASAPQQAAAEVGKGVGEGAPAGAPASDDALRAEQDKILAAPAKAPAARTEAKAKTAAEAKKKTAEKPEAAADGKPYVVQIAALADADKAGEVQKQLSAKGLRAYTEKVKTASGEVTRVRVGPFPTREAADKERGRIKALGFDGNVMPR
ncbi:MAG: hypothetical protein EHM59_08945 [Betaproteobacteria bacterium]|nr:MAG: hypothetical protein EHM59_08945 [Betaproteobacteria bacterium]